MHARSLSSGAILDRRRLVSRLVRPFEPFEALVKSASDTPEGVEHADESQGLGGIAVPEVPVERLSEIVVVRIKLEQPLPLSVSAQLSLCALGECEVMAGVLRVDFIRLFVDIEPLPRVLAHGLQHQQATRSGRVGPDSQELLLD